MNPPARCFSKWLIFGLLASVAACVNPFAPGELEGDPVSDLLGDPSTIEGFYTRFQKAYELRDTSLYGPLIHADFTFTYRDHIQNQDISWGRPLEMNSTNNMFMLSYDLNLQWNNIIDQFINEPQTEATVFRSFNLSIREDPSEPPLRSNGIAYFRLTRTDSTQNWKLIFWRDDSDI
ncbi:hypothetical protein QLX67_05830 [Balneolaceae bacterium ANBcel3]|nr:hypothetical protein [Balneolaceae bacterium ANBcel3]